MIPIRQCQRMITFMRECDMLYLASVLVTSDMRSQGNITQGNR